MSAWLKEKGKESSVTVAATQMSCTESFEENIKNAEEMVYEAYNAGAQIILLQELFSGLYFCQEQDPKYFFWAHPVKDHPLLAGNFFFQYL